MPSVGIYALRHFPFRNMIVKVNYPVNGVVLVCVSGQLPLVSVELQNCSSLSIFYVKEMGRILREARISLLPSSYSQSVQFN